MPKTTSKRNGITPRVLVRIELEATPTRKPKERFEAQSVNGSMNGGNNYSKEIVGFAVFPKGTRVSSKEEYPEFREMIESKAEYVHWKPGSGVT